LKAVLLLRIASVLSLVHCALHTVGGVFGRPRHGAEEIAVIETMKSHRFDVMGSLRSYWDFFFGYGLVVTISLLVQSILLWQVSALVRKDAPSMKPVIALLFFSWVATAIVSGRYFFAAPAVTELLIAACLAVAFFTAAST